MRVLFTDDSNVPDISDLTPNKSYDFKPDQEDAPKVLGGWLTDDAGDEIFILIKKCAHIGGANWTIVE